MRKQDRARAGVLLLAFGAALAGCGDAEPTRAPDPASRQEAQAVAEAAEMLDERVPEGEAPADGNE